MKILRFTSSKHVKITDREEHAGQPAKRGRERMIGRGIRSSIGARKRKKDVLSKICVVCNRPFNWRKKWEKVRFFFTFLRLRLNILK